MSTPTPTPPPNFLPSTESVPLVFTGTLLCEQFYTTAVEGSTYLVGSSVPVPTAGANSAGVVCLLATLEVPKTFSAAPSPTSLLLTGNLSAAFPFSTESIVEGSGIAETFTVPVSEVLEGTATAAAVSTTSHSKSVTGPVVGSIVGAIVLALLVGGFLLWHKRKHRQQAPEPGHEWAQAPDKWTFGELEDPKHPERPHELQPTSRTSNA